MHTSISLFLFPQLFDTSKKKAKRLSSISAYPRSLLILDLCLSLISAYPWSLLILDLCLSSISAYPRSLLILDLCSSSISASIALIWQRDLSRAAELANPPPPVNFFGCISIAPRGRKVVHFLQAIKRFERLWFLVLTPQNRPILIAFLESSA